MLSSARMAIDRHIARRCEARALPRRQDCDAGDHAGGAIEISALRNGIEMRRDQECALCRIAPFQRHVEIAGDIGRRGKARQSRAVFAIRSCANCSPSP